MKRSLVVVGAALLVGLVGAVPFGYWSAQSTRYRNFRVVEPGEVYRSGQMSPGGLRTKVVEYGVRTVVSLREDVRDGGGPARPAGAVDGRDDGKDDRKSAAVTAEGDWCRSNGVEHVVLSPMHWEPPADGPPGAAAPVDANVRRFLALVGDRSKRPVLVHCFAGIHRTGGYVALYRMEFNGWSAEEAVREMESMGTPRTTFDDKISGYLRRYTPGRFAAAGAQPARRGPAARVNQ